MTKTTDSLERYLISTLCLLPDEAKPIFKILKDLTKERDQLKQQLKKVQNKCLMLSSMTEQMMEQQIYHSLVLDGKMMPVRIPAHCEWCGKRIPMGQTSVLRHYSLSDNYYKVCAEFMHLTCYDKAHAYCAEYGHTFERFNMRPIQYLSLGMHPDTLKGMLDIYDDEKECANQYILDVAERHSDTMEPILY